jgi:hypothetical protein
MANKACQPLVSVVIPTGGYIGQTYHKSRLDALSRVARDLRSQTYQPSEVIISINGNQNLSFVESVRNLFRHQKNVFIHDSSLSLSAEENFNRAVSFVKTAYFSIWSDHDIHEPSFLEECLACLDSSPGIGLVCPSMDVVDENGQKLNGSSVVPFRIDDTTAFARIKKVLVRNELGLIYGVYRTSVYRKLLRGCQSFAPDVLQVIDLARYSGVAILPKKLISFRIFTQKTSSRRNFERTKHRQLVSSYALIDPGSARTCSVISSAFILINDAKELTRLQKICLSWRAFWFFDSAMTGAPLATLRDLFQSLSLCWLGLLGSAGCELMVCLRTFFLCLEICIYGFISGAYMASLAFYVHRKWLGKVEEFFLY